MNFRINPQAIGRQWSQLPSGDKARLLADISITPRSKLRLKVGVFQNHRDMKAFCRDALDRAWLVRKTTGGFVTDLALKYDGFVMVDPCYFAFMGLLESHLKIEIVAHEAVHAGFAYNRRARRTWPGSAENDEETICYPAGRVTSMVLDLLHQNGFAVTL